MKITCISDLHLRLTDSMGVMENGLNSRLSDRLASCRTAIEVATSSKSDVFIIDGDIFDKINPPEKLRKLFIKHVVAPLINFNIPIIINVGNHDTNFDIVSFESEVELLESISNSYIKLIREPEIVEFADGRIYFVPYGFPIPENNEDCNVLFGHHGVKGAETGIGVLQRHGEELDSQNFKAFTYSILGHYHKPQKILISAKSSIVYVGSTNVWDFGERLDKKRFLQIDFSDNKIKELTSYLLPERKFLQFNIEEGNSWETKEDITDAVVKLVFAGSRTWLSSLNFQKIKKDYESLLPHKIVIDQRSQVEERRLFMKVEETETEIQIIEKWAQQKDVGKELLEKGLALFDSANIGI